jgi:hypothetical protein
MESPLFTNLVTTHPGTRSIRYLWYRRSASKAPQNLNPKMKEMIAVEVDRTGGMMPSPADRNPGPVTGHFRYRRSSAPIQATGAPGPIGKRCATREDQWRRDLVVLATHAMSESP